MGNHSTGNEKAQNVMARRFGAGAPTWSPGKKDPSCYWPRSNARSLPTLSLLLSAEGTITVLSQETRIYQKLTICSFLHTALFEQDNIIKWGTLISWDKHHWPHLWQYKRNLQRGKKENLYPINQSILVHKIWEHKSMNCNRAWRSLISRSKY